ncbi:MAG: hypothetical protein QM758_10655 [Armatimonas sp.]
MPRSIILDTFPVSCIGKPKQDTQKTTDICRDWVFACIQAGNSVYIPEIAYYESLRELERTGSTVQIARLKAFCEALPERYIPLTTVQIENAAKLWAQARNSGQQTASKDSLDGDMLLVAQTLSLGLSPTDYVIATTNLNHISLFAVAQDWTTILPGS